MASSGISIGLTNAWFSTGTSLPLLRSSATHPITRVPEETLGIETMADQQWAVLMLELRDKAGKRNSMRYKVVLRQSAEGYDVSCPGLPGCWSQGATEAEAMENIRSAIMEYLAAVNDTLKDADVREVDVPA